MNTFNSDYHSLPDPFYFLSLAAQAEAMGVAYAIWGRMGKLFALKG